jgi:uncharacterized phiE125 gp8 family phage protein
MLSRLAPVRVVPPAVQPITVADVKAQVRQSLDDEDGLIVGLIQAVAGHLDGYSGILGKALISQTWAESFRYFRDGVRLSVGPFQSIVSVTYFDGDGAQQTLPSSIYTIHSDDRGPMLWLKPGQSWPSIESRPDAITATYRAGYGDTPDSVPAEIRQAMLLLVGGYYQNREAVAAGITFAELPMGVKALLGPHRRRAY